MDKSVLVAIIALCGTLITVAGGVIIAILTSNKESKNAAGSALEKALRERLVLRDEQLQDAHIARNLEKERRIAAEERVIALEAQMELMKTATDEGRGP